MNEKLNVYDEKMTKSVNNLNGELATIRAGRANPHVLDKLSVEYYGAPTPIQQVANVSVPEARMIQIQPWEKSMLKEIDRKYIHGEHLYDFGQKSHQFIVTKTDKYVWFSQTGEEQYFNLIKDKDEAHNAINDLEYKDRIEELKNILIKELKESEEGYSDGEKLIVGCKTKPSLSNAILR